MDGADPAVLMVNAGEPAVPAAPRDGPETAALPAVTTQVVRTGRAWDAEEGRLLTDALARCVSPAVSPQTGVNAWRALAATAEPAQVAEATARVRAQVVGRMPFWRPGSAARAAVLELFVTARPQGQVYGRSVWAATREETSWVLDAIWPEAAGDPEASQGYQDIEAREARGRLLVAAAETADLGAADLARLQELGRTLSDVQQALTRANRQAELPPSLWRKRPVMERRELARTSDNMDGLLRLVASRDDDTTRTLVRREDLRDDVRAALARLLGASVNAEGLVEIAKGAYSISGRYLAPGSQHLGEYAEVAGSPGLPAAIRQAAVRRLVAGIARPPGEGRPEETWKVYKNATATAMNATAGGYYGATSPNVLPAGRPDRLVWREGDAEVWAEALGACEPAVWPSLDLFGPSRYLGWIQLLAARLGPGAVYTVLSGPLEPDLARSRAAALERLLLASPETLRAWSPEQWTGLLHGPDRELRLAVLRARAALAGAPGVAEPATGGTRRGGP